MSRSRIGTPFDSGGASGVVSDASATVKGVLKLAGQLGGTASVPKVRVTAANASIVVTDSPTALAVGVGVIDGGTP